MRVALLTTLGEQVDRLDNEAASEAALRRLRERGLEVLVLARRTQAAQAVLGEDVEVAQCLEFPREPIDRERYLGEITAVTEGHLDALPAHDQVFPLIETLRGVDALVMGGASLDSPTGWLLYERAAVARIAASLGLPVVMTGIGLGPFLSRNDTAVLRNLFSSVSLVGLRDQPSHMLARRLVPDHRGIVRCLDDAALLANEVGENREESPASRGVLIATPGVGRDTLARVGAFISDLTGSLPVWLHQDADAIEAVALAAASDVLVTSCRSLVHAGLAGGAAVVSLAHDHPAEQRLGSVIIDWEVRHPPLPLATVVHGSRDDRAWDHVAARIQGALQGRETGARKCALRKAELLAADHLWWDTVVETLCDPSKSPPDHVVPRNPASLPPQSASGTPAVAIVMRTRDRPLLLERAVDDVLAQTHGDWHLVVVNDGGDPVPVDRLLHERRESLADRVTVVHHSPTRGMEAASNAGLRASNSTYVVIHDDDDQWHPEFLELAVRYLDDPATTDDGVIVRTEIVYERIDGDAIVEEGRQLYWADLDAITLHDMVKLNRAVPISFLYRRAVHADIGEYDERLPAVGDWAFHLRFLASRAIGFIDGAPLAFWNQRPGQDGTAGNSVFEAAAAHRKYDLLVREGYFKNWVASNGLGLPLYLTKMTEREVEEVRQHVQRLEHAVQAQGEALRALVTAADQLNRTVAEQRTTLEHLDSSLVDRVDAVVRHHSLIDLVRRRYHRLRRT